MSTSTPFDMFRHRVNVFGIIRTTCSRAVVCGCVVLCGGRPPFSKKTDIVRFGGTWFEMFGFPFRSWCPGVDNIRTRVVGDWLVRGIATVRKRGHRSRKFFRITVAGQIETTGFAISRFWGQEPTWFENLSPELKCRVLADYRIQCDDEKTRKQKADKIKIDRIRRRRGAI